MSEQSPAYCDDRGKEARERLTPNEEAQAPVEVFTYLLHLVTQGQRPSRVYRHHMDLERLAEEARAEHHAMRPMPPVTREDVLQAAALVVADDLRRLRTLLHEVGPAILAQRRWMDVKADMATGRFIGMAQATLDYAIATLTETPRARVQAKDDSIRHLPDKYRHLLEWVFITAGRPGLWRPSEDFLASLLDMYPEVSLEDRLREALVYLDADPKRRWKAEKMENFLHGWFRGALTSIENKAQHGSGCVGQGK